MIGFSGIGTFILLKLIGLVVPLRMADKDLEEGDLAVHGHEVYPSDVPSLGFPNGIPAPRTRPGLRPKRRSEASTSKRRGDRTEAPSWVDLPASSLRRRALQLLLVAAGDGREDVDHRDGGRGGSRSRRRRGDDVADRASGESARTTTSSRTRESASRGTSATPTPAATRPWTVW